MSTFWSLRLLFRLFTHESLCTGGFFFVLSFYLCFLSYIYISIYLFIYIYRRCAVSYFQSFKKKPMKAYVYIVAQIYSAG